MYEAVMRLEEPYQLAVADEDMEKCLNYCRQASYIKAQTGQKNFEYRNSVSKFIKSESKFRILMIEIEKMPCFFLI
jgi:hypothetical protein